ncbi:Uncoordinated protein 58 [Trichinella nativa]|uniref:Uncoordinated protein 58 n=1 Tax=Trichinella nativa TaxID=6335 RepID=A0A0V1LVM5_9BILA|nr:Uncoordinated protein 58 [Trichinella nativa]
MIMVERSEDHPEKWFSVKRRWQADLRRQIFLSWRYGYSGKLLRKSRNEYTELREFEELTGKRVSLPPNTWLSTPLPIERKKSSFWHTDVSFGLVDHLNRWEGLPLTPIDGNVSDIDDLPTLVAEGVLDQSDHDIDTSVKHLILKALKISIPHVLLLAVLLSYIAFGAVVLQRIENGTNVLSRLNRHYALEKTFHALVNETWELQGRGLTYKQWQSELFDRLQNISLLYEGRRTSIDQSLPMAEWTFPTAVLYALTVLTACGYNFIDPVTDGGKVFAIAFALVGIPLMFITAADIGKFLSETFQRVCVWSNRLYRAFLSNFSRKDKEVNQNRRLSASEKNTIFDDLADEANEDELGSDSLWFPIGAYVFLMCLYCSIGALLFCSFEDNWGFIHAFHFAFNTVVTVGMGNIFVTDAIYLCLIVVYVVIGLAVVTMCVDLASTHLQTYFRKIHYFGRARQRFLGMSDDIREIVSLISTLRKKKGGKVTWDDLKQYLEAERMRPFIPRNIHLWKYVDETSSAVSTYRHSSLISSSSTASRRPSTLRFEREIVDTSNNGQ